MAVPPTANICWPDEYAVVHCQASWDRRGKEVPRIVGKHEAIAIAQQDRVAKMLIYFGQASDLKTSWGSIWMYSVWCSRATAMDTIHG